MAFAKYPPVTTGEAIAVLKQDVELYHNIVHGDENTEVLTENGLVPSVDKVLKELLDRIGEGTGADVTLRPDLAALNSMVSVAGIQASTIKKRIDNYTTPEAEGGLALALATGKPVMLQPNTDYILSEVLIVPENGVIFGPKTARLVSTIEGSHCIELQSYAQLSGFTITDNFVLSSAKGILCRTGSVLQSTDHLNVLFPNHCIMFEQNAGSGFSSSNDRWACRGNPATTAAYKNLATHTMSIPHKFTNPEAGGGCLFDLSGCNGFFASNFWTNGIITSDTTGRGMIVNARIANPTVGNLQLRGSNCVYTNMVFSGGVDVYATDSVIEVVCANWEVNDFGTGNSIDIRLRTDWVPVFRCGGTPITLGDGTVKGYWSRNGSQITCFGEMVIGASTVMGTGNLSVDLPTNAQAINITFVPTLLGTYQKIGAVRPNYIGVPVMGDDKLSAVFQYTDETGTCVTIEKTGTEVVGNANRVDVAPSYFPTFFPDLDGAVDVYHNGIKLWKTIGTNRFSLVDNDTVQLNFTPAGSDTIVVQLRQPFRRNTTGHQEQWPAFTRLRWHFQYTCK